jgi:hypothetical protein
MTKIKFLITISFLVITLIVFAIPPLIKWQLEYRLGECLKLEVSIKSIELNPIKGEYRISELKVGDSLALASGLIEINLLPMLNERIQVRNISINGFVTRINKTGDLISVGEYKIPAAATSSNNGARSSWTYQIDKINIGNTQLDLDIDGQVHKLRLDTLDIGPITTDLKKAINLSIELLLDETPILANGEYALSSTEHKFEGDLNITKFNLKRLKSLLKQPIEGIVTTNQHLIFSTLFH